MVVVNIIGIVIFTGKFLEIGFNDISWCITYKTYHRELN